MNYDKADNFFENLFERLLSRYQIGLNPINIFDDKCFQCPATLALNHDEIAKKTKHQKSNIL